MLHKHSSSRGIMLGSWNRSQKTKATMWSFCIYNNYRRNWVVTGIKRNGANCVNGQNQQKQKQKLSPITQFDFYTNSHIGLFGSVVFCFVLDEKKKKKNASKLIHLQKKKQTKWNASCPEEAFVNGGCQKSQNSRPCSHVPHARSVLF